MSIVSEILDEIQTAAEAVIPGLTTTRENIAIDAVPADTYPHMILLQTGYASEALEFRQELRTYSIAGTLVDRVENRDVIQQWLEDLWNQLDGSTPPTPEAYRVVYTNAVPATFQADAVRGYGLFTLDVSTIT